MALRDPGPEPLLFCSSRTGDGDLDGDFESSDGGSTTVTVRDEDLTESPPSSSSSGSVGEVVAVDVVAEDDDPC